MALSAERLVRLLEQTRGVDEWAAFETRVLRVARETGARPSRSSAETIALGAVVFHDTERGRGTSRLSLDIEGGDEGHARALIERAVERAGLSLGPAWGLPAPAAPARVSVADPDIAGDPSGAVDEVVGQLGAASGKQAAIGRARVDAEWRSHLAETSRGFASQYQSTAIGFDVAVGAVGGALLEPLRVRVSSAGQLSVQRRLTEAARDAGRRAAARPLEPGRFDLLLRARAIAPGGLQAPADAAGYGWFAPLVANADGEWARLGIGRYRPGQPVFGPAPRSTRSARPPGTDALTGAGGPALAETEADPFTLSSDGTIDFAPMSAPFGDLGEPVRRFDIVRAGAAADLALDYREAALARALSNGGVRNLVLAPGRTPASRLAEGGRRPVLEIDELAWLDVDPRSGALTAGIRLGQVRGAAVASGLVVGNAFDLLARARLSAETTTLGWYRGPVALRIDGVDLAAS